MLFDYKNCNDASIQEAIIKACDDSCGLAYGARYVLRSEKLIIAFYSDKIDIKKESLFSNISKAIEESLPSKYKNSYEIWSMDDFYKNVPSWIYKRAWKLNRRE